jgi:hypothetical protein
MCLDCGFEEQTTNRGKGECGNGVNGVGRQGWSDPNKLLRNKHAKSGR